MDRALDFGAAVRFPFDRRAWGEKAFINLLLVTVCFLIPLAGPFVVLGYGVLVEKAIVQDPLGPMPLFDFGKFGDHLRRGVAPFVVGLLMLPVFFLVAAAVIIPAALLLANSHAQGFEVVAVLGASYLLVLLIMFFVQILLWPVSIRSMLEQKIGQAFGWAFIRDFHSRMWREELKLLGFILLLMLPIMIVSCIPFVSYFVVAILMNVGWYANAHLYRGYVARGGKPLDIEPVFVMEASAFPVVQADHS